MHFASTWSFHENDLIVIGSNDSDMAIASNHLIKNQGGLVVVKSGKILSSLPLQFGGIVSTDSFETVSSNFEKINNSIVDLGCKFNRPHLIPLFLPFLALPSVRILAGGIVDVKKTILRIAYQLGNVKKGGFRGSKLNLNGINSTRTKMDQF